MSIGGYNNELHLSKEQTNIITYNDFDGFYNIQINKIKINGLELDIEKKDMINPFIDSGTTLFFGPK